MRLKLICVLGLLLGLTQTGAAQQLQYVGIPSLSFYPAAQMQDEWCWAASVQMILNYYGIPTNQPMIVARVHHVLTDQAGSDEDISNSLTGWAPGVDGQTRIVQSETSGGAPPPLVLIQELSQKHPILLTFATGVYSGHAVVITGASYVPTANGPFIMSLIIRDPWPSANNIRTQGRVEIGGQALANFMPLVRSFWLVSVSTNGVHSSVSTRRRSEQNEEEASEDSEDSGLCSDLKLYAAAAVNNFRSLKGARTDLEADDKVYLARRGVSGFTNCEIYIYSDPELHPSATCDAADGDVDDLRQKVSSCFPDWSSRHKALTHGDRYAFTAPTGVEVRVESSRSGVDLWVDSPDE